MSKSLKLTLFATLIAGMVGSVSAHAVSTDNPCADLQNQLFTSGAAEIYYPIGDNQYWHAPLEVTIHSQTATSAHGATYSVYWQAKGYYTGWSGNNDSDYKQHGTLNCTRARNSQTDKNDYTITLTLPQGVTTTGKSSWQGHFPGATFTGLYSPGDQTTNVPAKINLTTASSPWGLGGATGSALALTQQQLKQ